MCLPQLSMSTGFIGTQDVKLELLGAFLYFLNGYIV